MNLRRQRQDTEELLLTVVSSSRSLRSRVVPEGTATFDRTMVEHDFWDLLALDAPEEPEKVQLVALLARLGASVIAGSATDAAMTFPARAAKMKGRNIFVIVLWYFWPLEKVS